MYTVVDFEFNQAFDFGEGSPETDPACRFEIIQIGAVRLDEDFNETDRFSVFIKPEIYTRLHPYVARMTGISAAELEKADGFKKAYAAFRAFAGDSRIYCVWGNSDIRVLYRNLCYHGMIEGDIVAEYIDVQQIMARYLKYGRGRSIGLKNAADMLGIEEKLPFHNALCDAVYTAEIFKRIHGAGNGIRIFNSKHIPKRERKKEARKNAGSK